MEKPSAVAARTFPTAQEDAEKEIVSPNARYEGPESAYRLAFTDGDFLLREELRPIRLQLELLKPPPGPDAPACGRSCESPSSSRTSWASRRPSSSSAAPGSSRPRSPSPSSPPRARAATP